MELQVRNPGQLESPVAEGIGLAAIILAGIIWACPRWFRRMPHWLALPPRLAVFWAIRSTARFRPTVKTSSVSGRLA